MEGGKGMHSKKNALFACAFAKVSREFFARIVAQDVYRTRVLLMMLTLSPPFCRLQF